MFTISTSRFGYGLVYVKEYEQVINIIYFFLIGSFINS